MKFLPVCATMQQSEDGVYQISRSPKPEGGEYIYRAWHRPTNTELGRVTVVNEPGERAAAIVHCRAACETDAGSRA